MDFDIAIRILLWEEGESYLVPLSWDECNTSLLPSAPGPVLALATLSAEAKQSKATLLQAMQN